MSIDPREALEEAERELEIWKRILPHPQDGTSDLRYLHSLAALRLVKARALLAVPPPSAPEEWDGRSIGESAPHAAYCDLAMSDAMIQIKDGEELVWSYDDALFDKSLAGNGFKVVPIDVPSPSGTAMKPDGSNPHLVSGDFQSDKYPTTPLGKVPLSTKDPMAQDLLSEYARRRRAVDAEFADALETALANRGYVPSPSGAGWFVPERMLSRLGRVAERMRFRVDAIVEREGSIEKAITSHGVGIGYLLAKEIFEACRTAADVMDAQVPSPSGEVRDALFASLAHGDAGHRQWLRDALDAHFAGQPVPPPILGKTREEAIEEAVENAENDLWDDVIDACKQAWPERDKIYHAYPVKTQGS